MITTKFINLENIANCLELISKSNQDDNYFSDIGWNIKEINKQIIKTHNLSLGLWKSKNLIGFIIGELIFVEKKSEYEIFILYIDSKNRKKGYASYLINALSKFIYLYPLKQITLEVSSINIPAINLYKKNEFNISGKRKDYYNMKNNKKFDALIFKKLINS